MNIWLRLGYAFREEHVKGGSFANLAFYGYGTVHALDHMAHNREAESGATDLAGARFVDSIEPLEDSRKVLGRNADAGVGYPNCHAPIFAGDTHAHFAVGAVELDGVSQKV